MLALFRYYLSPFSDPEISVEELIRYALEHLARMIANNPGAKLDSLITFTSNLLAALNTNISSETVRLGVQKASVQAKNDFRAGLSNELSKIYGACLGKWGKKNSKMIEVFPGGLDAFGAANDDQLDPLLEALVTSLTANLAILTADPITQAQTLDSTWTGLYGMSNTSKGQKTSAADLRRNAVKALRAQLFQNLLFLASLFPDDEAKASLYHPQHLLENPTKAATTPAATPAA